MHFNGHIYLKYIAPETITYTKQECAPFHLAVQVSSHTQPNIGKLFKERNAELNAQFSVAGYLQNTVCSHQHYSYGVIISKIVNRPMCPIINMSIAFDALMCGQLVLTQPMFYSFFIMHQLESGPYQLIRFNIHIHYTESTPKDQIYLGQVYGIDSRLVHPYCFLLRDGKDVDIRIPNDKMFIVVHKYSNVSLNITFSGQRLAIPDANVNCQFESTFCQHYVSIHIIGTYLYYITQYGKISWHNIMFKCSSKTAVTIIIF